MPVLKTTPILVNERYPESKISSHLFQITFIFYFQVVDTLFLLYISYTADGHDLRFFEKPHPGPLPKGEGDKSRNPCPC